jgi:hypothetical protein
MKKDSCNHYENKKNDNMERKQCRNINCLFSCRCW